MDNNLSKCCAELTILPVSGGHFINQVALLTLLCEHGYNPKLLLGSSGGAITAYLGLCGNWTHNGILRVLEDLSSDIFISSWWKEGLFANNFLPSGFIGVFKGALYNHGTGSNDLIKKYLTRDSITRCEIWVGTYNKDTGSAGMFCNRNHESAYIRSGDDRNSMGNTTIKYLDGHLDDISKAIYASSCIPTLIPPIEIDNEKHWDGGLMSASPLIPLSDYLPDCLKIIYINSFNMEDTKADMVDCTNIIKLGIGSIANTVTGLCIADKIFAVRLVMKCDKMHFNTYDNMTDAVATYRSASKAVMELFPKRDLQVDITNFDSKKCVGIINEIRANYGIRLWWIE